MLTNSSLPAESILSLIADSGRMIRYRFDTATRELGVTRPQWRALLCILRQPGLSQADLADRLEVERITACRMIDRMAEAGLVERRADPRDRRVWRLHLTDAAKPLVDRLSEIARDIEEQTLAMLPPEHIAGFRESLSALRDALRREIASVRSAA